MDLDDLMDTDISSIMQFSKTRMGGLVSSSVERDTRSRSRSASKVKRKTHGAGHNLASDSEEPNESESFKFGSLEVKKKHLQKYARKSITATN